jgi:hypothetical protein
MSDHDPRPGLAEEDDPLGELDEGLFRDLEPEDGIPGRIRLPTPAGGHAAGRSTTQVSIRLRRDDHARLTRAAAAVGLRPTTLARELVLDGAARILQEAAGDGAHREARLA